MNDLKTAIEQLEKEQAEAAAMLRMQFRATLQSARPINLVKSAFAEATASSSLRGNLLNTSVGLATGLVSKALFVGFSHNPIKKLVGNALFLGITNTVAKHPEITRSLASGVLWMMGRRRRNGFEKV